MVNVNDRMDINPAKEDTQSDAEAKILLKRGVSKYPTLFHTLLEFKSINIKIKGSFFER